MGGPDKTDAIAIRTSERALHETEEFGTDQGRWYGRTIQYNERSLYPRAMAIDSPSDQLFSSSGFSLDQNREIGCRDLVYGLQNLCHSRVSCQYSVGLAVSMFQGFRATLCLAHCHCAPQSWRRQRAHLIQKVSLFFRKAISDLAVFQVDKCECFIARHQRRAQNRSKRKELYARLLAVRFSHCGVAD